MSQGTQTSRLERRNYPRVRVPSVHIRCDAEMYVVNDWSYGGCQFDKYTGCMRPGDRVSLELYMHDFHEVEGMPIEAAVMRFEPDDNNALALKFLDLTPQTILDYCDSVEKSVPNDDLDGLIQQMEKKVDLIFERI